MLLTLLRSTVIIPIGATLLAVASSTVQLTQNNIQSQLVRAIVTSAGATVVAGYVMIKAF